ncbi:MAG: hypothetical protein HYY18_14090 [Planctomycetes bacterium]|nr:hypothetical protein [Planctomycetota bacterium]
MKRLPLLLLTVSLSACSPFSERFEPGRAEVLEFRLSNGFWEDRFGPGTPIAAGGWVSLDAREDGKARALEVVSLDPGVIEVAGPVNAMDTEDGASYAVKLRAVAAGKATVEFRQGDVAVDSVEFTVKPVGSFDWRIYDPARQDRRDEDVLTVRLAESMEIEILFFDEAGERIAGAGAFRMEFGESKILSQVEPDRHECCAFHMLVIGSRAPVEVKGEAFGRTELVVNGVAGSAARRVITVKVGF